MYFKIMVQNRIREFRNKKHMSLQEVADAVNSTNQQIQRIEAGSRRLSDVWLEKLAKVFGCYPSELLPIEWQKPTEAVDEQVLETAIAKMLEIKEKEKGVFTNKQLAGLIRVFYKKLLNNKNMDSAEVFEMFQDFKRVFKK